VKKGAFIHRIKLTNSVFEPTRTATQLPKPTNCPNFQTFQTGGVFKQEYDLTTNHLYIDDPHLNTIARHPMFVKRWSKTDRSAKEVRYSCLKDRKLAD
jgi:hypothetical protein